MKMLLTSIVFLAAVGCGDKTKKVHADDPYLYDAPEASNQPPSEDATVPSIETVDDLPKCDETTNESIYYLSKENANFVCRDGKWENIGSLGL
ncbi:MAG: hypothetical protein AB7T49_05995 [Oligoflexales bacterium]